MRTVLIFAALFLWISGILYGSPAVAGPDEDAKAALALSQIKPAAKASACVCGPNCPCASGQCGDGACPTATKENATPPAGMMRTRQQNPDGTFGPWSEWKPLTSAPPRSDYSYTFPSAVPYQIRYAQQAMPVFTGGFRGGRGCGPGG